MLLVGPDDRIVLQGGVLVADLRRAIVLEPHLSARLLLALLEGCNPAIIVWITCQKKFPAKLRHKRRRFEKRNPGKRTCWLCAPSDHAPASRVGVPRIPHLPRPVLCAQRTSRNQPQQIQMGSPLYS